MAFWWVNHKQTYSQEIGGGYVWSPKNNANGARNETYLNLTRTQLGDIVFSYAGGLIQAVGVVADIWREQAKPSEFGKEGEGWSAVGWSVPIDWELLETPLVPKSHLEAIIPLMPEKNAPLQPNGNGNQGCYLAGISDQLGQVILQLIGQENLYANLALTSDQHAVEEAKAASAIQHLNIDATEKEQLIKARRGQGRFRQNVEAIESACRVTGVSVKPLLIASHIKPWRVSTNAERLDGNNGLLLSPHIDKLFDQGLISFTDWGDLLFADADIERVLGAWGVEVPLNIGSFNREQLGYLAYHRDYIFQHRASKLPA